MRVSAIPGIVACGLIFLFSPFLLWLSNKAPTGPKEVLLDPGRGIGWLVAMVAMAGLFMLFGYLIKGDLLGALIDRRNRYSLSRLQISLWTMLALPTIHMALLGNVLRAWGTEVPAIGVEIDWTLVALMGLSIGSFVAAPAVLSVKSGRTADSSEAKTTIGEASAREARSVDVYVVEGQLLKRRESKDAKFSDLFRGEETGNAATLDPARIQMLALTFIVWTVYAVDLANTFFSVSADSWILMKLPHFNEQLLALIAVSHGGYLAGKVVPNSSQPRQQATQDLASLDKIHRRADRLRTAVEGFRKENVTEDAAAVPLLHLEGRLRQLSAEADTLTDRVQGGATVSDASARLEGRLDAFESTFSVTKAQEIKQFPEDMPPASLVRSVKNKLTQAGYGALADTIIWDSAADQAFHQFMANVDLTIEQFSPNLVERLEEAEDLIA